MPEPHGSVGVRFEADGRADPEQELPQRELVHEPRAPGVQVGPFLGDLGGLSEGQNLLRDAVPGLGGHARREGVLLHHRGGENVEEEEGGDEDVGEEEDPGGGRLSDLALRLHHVAHQPSPVVQGGDFKERGHGLAEVAEVGVGPVGAVAVVAVKGDVPKEGEGEEGEGAGHDEPEPKHVERPEDAVLKRVHELGDRLDALIPVEAFEEPKHTHEPGDPQDPEGARVEAERLLRLLDRGGGDEGEAHEAVHHRVEDARPHYEKVEPVPVVLPIVSESEGHEFDQHLAEEDGG
mmetsp:Transcript_59808/g.135319  ORF Transcript_59808/g.135319 Transcript_59808/m.135319 type:complete len:292 (+) Transcript_59808:649-1524(+)